MLEYFRDLIRLFSASPVSIPRVSRKREVISSMNKAAYCPPVEPVVVEAVKEAEVKPKKNDTEMVKAMIESMSTPRNKQRHPNVMVAHNQEWDLNWLIEEE